MYPCNPQYVQRCTDCFGAGTHQRFVAKNLPRTCVNHWLKCIVHHPMIDQQIQFFLTLHQKGISFIALSVKIFDSALCAVFHLIHCKICKFYQVLQIIRITWIPGSSQRGAQPNLRSIRQQHRTGLKFLTDKWEEYPWQKIKNSSPDILAVMI